MSETLGFYLLILGGVLVVLGYLLILGAAFRYHLGWGFSVLLFPPTAFVFASRQFLRSLGGVLVILLGLVVAVAPIVINKFHLIDVELKPTEKDVENTIVVDGKKVVQKEPTLTVTGLKDFDYATLKEKPYLEVLQMANEDVTDQTLENLKGLTNLRELDLNNTQITDEGLKILNELPELKILRLKNTKITDEGFRQFLLQKESLEQLNLDKTSVTRKTCDEWKKAKDGRRVIPPS
jgi:Leucine-rich repeat (LRR) protein